MAFKCTTNGYVITDNEYFHGLTSYSSGSIGTISGIDVLKRLSTLAGSFTGSWTFGSLNTTFNATSILTGLPSLPDCDVLIKDGNIVEIVALIQKVVSSTIKCSAKIAYLNDLLGRINAALSIKKESVAQLQALINGIATQVQKLLVQIQTLKSEQSALDLANLKIQLDALMAKLKDAYNQYNTCVGSTKDYELELQALRVEQQDL